MNREHRFGELRCHADQGSHPNPEDSAGPAEKNDCRNAGDITGADGSGQGCHQRIEGADLAFATRYAALS